MGTNRIAIMCDAAKTRVPPSTFPQASKLSDSQERLDDSSLIDAAQRGNTAAFEELVRRYDRAVLRLAIHITGSEQDAEDIYQEAFLRAYRNMPRFRFECSFYTWIYRIVTNLCLDHLRKTHLRGQHVTMMVSRDGGEEEALSVLPDHTPGASPERSLNGRELGRCILRALQRLSPRERMVFELRHYQGLRLRTIAGILNTTEGTVKNTMFRAARKLRTQLAGIH